VLDEASVAKIFDRIEQKKLMEQQLQKQQQQQKQKQKDLEEEVVNTESGGEHQDQVNRADNEGDDDDGKDKQEQSLRQDADMEEQKTWKDVKSVNSEVNSNFDEKKAAPNAKQSANAISARLLYIIPPKKSRRRGELSGHCYLALYPPMPTFIQDKLKMIEEEEKAILEMLKEAEQIASPDSEGQGADQESIDIGAKTETDSNPQEQDITGTLTAVEVDQPSTNTPQQGNTDATSPQTQQSDAAVAPIITTIQVQAQEYQKQQPKHEMQCQTKITAADRSKALAQSRLLLSETITSLAKLCKDDSKKDQRCNYTGIQIELSPNQKIWKAEDKGSSGNSSSGRKFGMAAKYDSTIEQNDDFKQFVQAKKELEMEMTNRPKPPLGGGPLTETMNVNVGGDDKTGMGGGDPIAAIVLHLREKKEAARQAKKKTNADKKKSSKVKSGGDRGKRGGKVDREKSNKKTNRRKRSTKQGEPAKKSAPKMLLKK